MAIINSLNRWAVSANSMDMARSKWSQPASHKTTMMAGQLVPVLCKEVLPGDTFKIDLAAVVRSLTPAVPVMDNAFIDFYFFNVPNRIATLHDRDWQKIIGESFDSAWKPATTSSLASTGNVVALSDFGSEERNTGIQPQSLLNYYGVPVLSAAECDSFVDLSGNVSSIHLLKINGYYKIWNEWFRDENTQAPVDLALNEDLFYSIGCKGLWNGTEGSGSLMPVNKLFDYFTGALPAPQRGASVELPLGISAPVLTASSATTTISSSSNPLHWSKISGTTGGGNPTLVVGSSTGNTQAYYTSSSPTGPTMAPDNLYADLQEATAATINQIRIAFALQRYAEKSARGGNRYREWIKVMFHVNIADSIVQVPEYLGGCRIPLNITQVLQNSETSTTPLGTTGAFSNTAFRHKGVVKSFSEHGYLHCVACIRNTQSYSQGLFKDWYRNFITDYYNPTFANLGEQPIYKSELYLKGNPKLKDGDVFGYQEAWAEYRYNPTLITGYLAPDAGDTLLTPWTYTNNFVASPVLNSDFMMNPSSQIDATLVSQEQNYQYICDFYFPMVTTRPMPLYSIPGLIDHH